MDHFGKALHGLRKFWPVIIRKNNLDLGDRCHVSTAQLPPRKNSSTLIHAQQIIFPWFDAIPIFRNSATGYLLAPHPPFEIGIAQ